MTDRDIHSLLHHHHDKLLNQYREAQHDLVDIRRTLNENIIPRLTVDLGLQETDVVWLTEWLTDTASIFRLLRRHRFTRSFTLKAIRTVLVWRLRVLRPVLSQPFPKLLHCLPPPISDPFGHPIVLVKVSTLLQDSELWNVRDAFLQQLERLRLHLKCIPDPPHGRRGNERFPLQCICLVDLNDVSIQNIDLELLSWLLKDVAPHFPGLFAAVFLLNYSWMHSSVWSVAKRILPESAVSRVFFPSRETLLEYCSPSTLPAEYGGSLPPLDQIEDPLRGSEHPTRLGQPLPASLPDLQPRIPSSPPTPTTSSSQTTTDTSHPFPSLTTHPTSSTVHLSPTSPLNPYFGYPVTALLSSSPSATSTSSTSPSYPHAVIIIRHVRPHRRKRDLVRTLAVLWWRRWGSSTLTLLRIKATSMMTTRMRTMMTLTMIVVITIAIVHAKAKAISRRTDFSLTRFFDLNNRHVVTSRLQMGKLKKAVEEVDVAVYGRIMDKARNEQ